jgi:exopolyphosphatase / guanosine-5'-triphosphate,3'-diphosphate pyrophosphatase
MKKQVIIEIGTNSIKAMSAIRLQESWRILSHEVYPARLGEGLHHFSRLSAPAMQRNLQVLEQIVSEFPDKNNANVHIIATEGLRKAGNADKFTTAVMQRFGLSVKILSGEEEAGYSYLAATCGRIKSNQAICVLDIGGGSTELALGKTAEILQHRSFPMGAVGLAERFITTDPPSGEEVRQMQEFALETLSDFDTTQKTDELVAVGGTVTTLARVSGYGIRPESPTNADNHGMPLSLKEVQRLVGMFSQMPVSRIKKIPGMPEGRADIILAGAIILEAAMLHLEMQEATVSNRGVRYGYLFSLS